MQESSQCIKCGASMTFIGAQDMFECPYCGYSVYVKKEEPQKVIIKETYHSAPIHTGSYEGAMIPRPQELVFEAACKAIPKISGMKIVNSDRLLGRISAKAGMSFTSWGENISILIVGVSENMTNVVVESELKSFQVTDYGKNKKNEELILAAISAELQR